MAPDHEGTGYLEVAAGDYDLINVNGAKSFSLIEDTLAVRLTGFKTERDGTIDMVNKGVKKDEAINDRDRHHRLSRT